MKLLIITPSMDTEIGGMERFIIEISSRLIKLGHSVTILTGKGKKELTLGGIEIIRYNIWKPKLFNKLIKYIHLSVFAKRHLKKNKYDIVVAMGHSGLFLNNYLWRASGSPIALIKKEKRKLKLNLLTRFIIFFDLFSQEVIERICIRKAKFHMFPSIALKNHFEKTYDFKAYRYNTL